MIESCTIIATDANVIVAPIHNRMPVITAREDYGRWLDTVATGSDEIGKLLRPYPAKQIEAVAVSTWVNNPRHEGKKCVETFTGAAGP